MKTYIDGASVHDPTEITYYCKACGTNKSSQYFHKDKKTKRGICYYCKECANSKSRAHTAKYGKTEKYRLQKWNSYYLFKYDMTLDERVALLNSQGCKCVICKTALDASGGGTHTDHCHTTGKVRGLLCTNCNRGLGHFQENKEFLMAAINYLQAHTDNGNQKEGSCL